jgi:hypothetical protein
MKLRFMPRSTPGAFDATGPADDAFHRRTATPADDRGERRPRDPAAHRPVSQCLSSWQPAVLAGSGRHPPDCGVRHPEPERTAEPAKSQRPVPATAVIRPPNLNGGSPKVRQARSTVSRWPYVIARQAPCDDPTGHKGNTEHRHASVPCTHIEIGRFVVPDAGDRPEGARGGLALEQPVNLGNGRSPNSPRTSTLDVTSHSRVRTDRRPGQDRV